MLTQNKYLNFYSWSCDGLGCTSYFEIQYFINKLATLISASLKELNGLRPIFNTGVLTY